jgi:hypothetical protein
MVGVFCWRQISGFSRFCHPCAVHAKCLVLPGFVTFEPHVKIACFSVVCHPLASIKDFAGTLTFINFVTRSASHWSRKKLRFSQVCHLRCNRANSLARDASRLRAAASSASRDRCSTSARIAAFRSRSILEIISATRGRCISLYAA